MKYSVPFLAKMEEQIPSPGCYGHSAVEGVIFNRADLESETWRAVWRNMENASKLYGGESVSFHFPVNDSNYVEDLFVRGRVKEALQRATDLNLRAVVVHSNRIEKLPWISQNLPHMRREVVDTLEEIRENVKGKTYLTLENMPVMDNWGIEIDPLFVFPSDFKDLINVKVIWDICHYTNSLANMSEVIAGHQNPLYYPNIQDKQPLDFLEIKDRIVHWHFSAFKGIANPETKSVCHEGVLPKDAELGSSLYAKCLKAIKDVASPEDHMVFEIQERDYINRTNIKEMIAWAFRI
jgi:hypothetical protein